MVENHNVNIEGESEQVRSVQWGLVCLSLSMFLASLCTSIVNVALPTFTQAFNTNFQAVQWIVLSYLLAITTMIVSVGRFGDLVGRRKLLLAGLIIFTVASGMCGLATDLWMMIGARVLQGLGAAIMMALSLAFVSETVPKARIGMAMGVLGTMSAIGTAMGPTVGGVLISGIGWPSIFFINIPLGIAAFYFTYRYLPLDHITHGLSQFKFDYLGTLFLAMTLAAYALAMTLGGGNFGLLNIVLLLISLLGIGSFIFIESKSSSPLIQLTIFSDPLLSAGFMMSGLVATVLMATLVIGPFYLSHALGLNAMFVGIVMSVGPCVVALTGVLAGRMVDHFGAHKITIFGLFGIAVGSFILSMIPEACGIPGFLVPMVIITFGYALFNTANNAAVMMHVQSDQRGVISGMLNLSRNLGLITGASFMGAVFAVASGASDILIAQPHAVATGMRMTFLIAGVLIVIANIMAILSRIFRLRVTAMSDNNPS